MNKNKKFRSSIIALVASGLIITTGAFTISNIDRDQYSIVQSLFALEEVVDSETITAGNFVVAEDETWSISGTLTNHPSVIEGAEYRVSGAESTSTIETVNGEAGIEYTINGLTYNKDYDSIKIEYFTPEVIASEGVDAVPEVIHFTWNISPFSILNPTITSKSQTETLFNDVTYQVDFGNISENNSINSTSIVIGEQTILGEKIEETNSYKYKISGLDAGVTYPAELTYDWGWGSDKEEIDISTLKSDGATFIVDENRVHKNDASVSFVLSHDDENKLPEDYSVSSIDVNAKFIDTEGNEIIATTTENTNDYYQDDVYRYIITSSVLDSRTEYSVSVDVKYNITSTLEEITEQTVTYTQENVFTTDLVKSEFQSVTIDTITPNSVEGTFSIILNDRKFGESEVKFRAGTKNGKALNIVANPKETLKEPDTAPKVFDYTISGLETNTEYDGNSVDEAIDYVYIENDDDRITLDAFTTPQIPEFNFYVDQEERDYYDATIRAIIQNAENSDVDINSFEFILSSTKLENDIVLSSEYNTGRTFTLKTNGELDSATNYDDATITVSYKLNSSEENKFTNDVLYLDPINIDGLTTVNTITSSPLTISGFNPTNNYDEVTGELTSIEIDYDLQLESTSQGDPTEEGFVKYTINEIPEIITLHWEAFSIYDGNPIAGYSGTKEIFNNELTNEFSLDQVYESQEAGKFSLQTSIDREEGLRNNAYYEFSLKAKTTSNEDFIQLEIPSDKEILYVNPIEYSAPDSAAFSINALSNEEVYLNYNYSYDHDDEIYSKPNEVTIGVKDQSRATKSNKTFTTLGDSGQINIVDENVNGFNSDTFVEGQEYSITIESLSFGELPFIDENGVQESDSALSDTSIYLVTDSSMDLVMPNITFYDVHKHIWLIVILILIITGGALTFTYYQLVYLKTGSWKWPSNKNEVSTPINKNEISVQTISAKFNLDSSTLNPTQTVLVNEIVKLEKEIKNEKLLAISEKANQSNDNRKSEQLHEIKGRNDVLKNFMNSLDMINLTLTAGENNINTLDPSQKQQLEGWLTAFKGISEKMTSDVGVVVINPTKGSDFNKEEHKIVEQVSTTEVGSGKIISVKKLGYKTKDGVLRAAEVVTSN